MTLKLNSKKLLTALNLCKAAINANGIVPATSSFQFLTTAGTLNISACNGEVSMQTSIDVIGDANVLIPADKAIELLSSLPDQPIEINISEDYEITVKYTGGVVSFSGYSPDGFLVIKTETENTAKVSSEDLQAAIYSTAYARSVDAIQQTFMGLNVDVLKDRLTFAGCNLMLLSVYNVTGKFKPAKLLLPTAITNIIGGITITGDVSVDYSANSISFTYAGLTVKSLLMSETMPDYRPIVPKNEVLVSVDRLQLIGALKRVLAFSNKVSKQVYITSDNGTLTIYGSDTSFKQQAKETLSIPEQSQIEISVNGAFFQSALSHMGSETIEILWSSPTVAIILREPNEADNFVMIMAMEKL